MLLVLNRSWLVLLLTLLLPIVGMGQKVDKKAQRERQERRTEYQQKAEDAVKSGNLDLAWTYYDSVLSLGFVREVVWERAEVHRLRGDRARYCADIRSASDEFRADRREPYRSACVRYDSVPFSHTGLSQRRFPDATNVSRTLSFADGRTSYSMYDSRDSLIAELSIAPGDTIFSKVDSAASYTGGLEAMYKFLAQTTRYPRAALNAGVMGRVFVRFVIEKDGTTRDHLVVRGVHPELDAEAVRVLKLMPNWQPATFHGDPVPIQYILPINFVLR